ncbi:hypothetical protein E2986_14046 [Frieseomelitta varia]|uniref:C2H2-type domain-containing protein n=1 Tax=Frieseomelitta varia TaxID=561572 RepID=A0A833RYW9_9HYME|nr:hypothetical protein E2986_14046 [Frieseomelitta varia]
MEQKKRRTAVKNENGVCWDLGKMAYHCPICNAGYTYKKTLRTHMKYDCGKEPRFKCPYCNKRDKCSSNIYKHIRMRHDGMPNVPRRRRKVYSVNKSHYCPRCNRGFTLKKNMTRHLRHECGMEPKYQCPYCDKPSKFTQNIYAHIRKYHPVMFNLSTLPYLTVVTTDRRRRCYETGMLPTVNTASRGSFECPKCQKTYKWYRGLHRHLKYECGKAPRFQCPHCMYTGKHRSHVYSHIKSNHSDRPIYALDTQQG